MDSSDDTDPAPPDPPPATPLGLEYFSTDAPERRTSRAVTQALGVVAVSLLPFGCGVVNVLVAAQSYSATVTGSHRGGAALFLVAGIGLCVVGLARLLALRETGPVLVALLVLALELAVVTCVGFATFWG
jgi:hypothetical protein